MKKLCVVFGGSSCEHDVSVVTGMQLAKNIANIEKIYCSRDDRFFLATKITKVSYFESYEKLGLKEVVFHNGAVYVKGIIFKKLLVAPCTWDLSSPTRGRAHIP